MRGGSRERTLWWRGIEVQVYRPSARLLHWLTVLLLAVLIPSGLWMTTRAELKLWDETTNTLYSLHKLIGFTLLWLVVLRLAVRLVFGAPPEPVQLGAAQKSISRATHWAIYALLLLVPLAGWAGVSLFPALNVFGWFDLPALASPDKAMAEVVFSYHAALARLLIALIVLHVAAALLHGLILRDGIFQRMVPPRRRRPY